MTKRRRNQRKSKGSKMKGASRANTTAVRSPAIRDMLSRASIFHRSGHHADARSLYQQVLSIDPENAYAHFGLGQCVGRLGNIDEGIRLTKRAVELDPNNASYHVSLADLLFSAVRIDKSMEEARKALEVDSRSVSARCVLASGLERHQEIEEGIRILLQAENIAPRDVYVQTLLARLERRNKDYRSALQRLENIMNRSDIEAEYRRRALFELASVLDRLGEYKKAYQAIDEYGRLTLETPQARRLNRQARPARIASYKAGITRDLLTNWTMTHYEEFRPAPVFLVGFPRSGTTMTEQILAAHSRIQTSDEQPYVNLMRSAWVRMVGGSDEVRGMFDRLTIDGACELRRLYWNAVDKDFQQLMPETIFIDKLPLNLIDIGLINVIFPDAKVIVALRDPRDVCLSCLMQDFALNNAMIHFCRLKDTAAFYEQVMGFYLAVRDILTVAKIEIRYEDTVTDLESQARRVLEFLQAEWEPETLRFYEKARTRTISTPSFEAVAQPVHRGAIGRWRNYRPFFEPVLPQLAPFVQAFGYDDDA